RRERAVVGVAGAEVWHPERLRKSFMPGTRTVLIVLAALLALAVAGFLALRSPGASRGAAARAVAQVPAAASAGGGGGLPTPHPQVVEPSAGVDSGGAPVGNPHAAAPSDA